MEYKLQGIVLGKKDVGETDRIYTVYTLEQGKIRILGKGSRKINAKLAGNLETITESEIFIAKNRGMGKVIGSIAGNNFKKIKEDLDLLENVFYVFRILSRFVQDEESDYEIFSLLENYLKKMDTLEGKAAAEVLTAGVIFKLLDKLGYRLEMSYCVRCEKKLIPEKNYLSISGGGVVCSECGRKEKAKKAIDNEMIKLIRIFLNNKPETIIKIKITELEIRKLKTIIGEAVAWFSGEAEFV